MELPLRRMPNCEQRSVIRFLTAKNTSAVEIHRQLSSVYGEETMSVQHLRKWIRDFSNGCGAAASFGNWTQSFMRVTNA